MYPLHLISLHTEDPWLVTQRDTVFHSHMDFECLFLMTNNGVGHRCLYHAEIKALRTKCIVHETESGNTGPIPVL
ncbi:hypothetical protein XELAEV_18018202mg [Xenopus laevis]|uniref:Uncharacterized protein n=1 Tax=Xenopus laevis TaxID=8355 RepID=A0A974HTD0_XENLA|nr:hypothetical protein XELAEV_18018202mg [Xenopus laevis]